MLLKTILFLAWTAIVWIVSACCWYKAGYEDAKRERKQGISEDLAKIMKEY